MSLLRGLQTLQRLFTPRISNVKSLSTLPSVTQHNDDMPVKMDNPFKQPPKVCILHHITVDYKNIQLLSQFISPHTGRIYGRHLTGLCAKKQRDVTKAIKKARTMGFMSVTHKHPQFMKDPTICDIRHLE